MVLLPGIETFLNQLLKAGPGPEEPLGILKPAPGEIRRMGLALEPQPGLAEWAGEQRLDALLVHRPWGLALDDLPEAAGLLAYHQPFDLWLNSADNPCLAQDFGLVETHPLTWRSGQPVGVVGRFLPAAWQDFLSQVSAAFLGYDEVRPPVREPVQGAAFVGALTGELVHAASALGANVYVTGQARQPGLDAIRQTGLGLVITGHRRGELWGLRCLGQVLAEQFPGVRVLRFEGGSW